MHNSKSLDFKTKSKVLRSINFRWNQLELRSGFDRIDNKIKINRYITSIILILLFTKMKLVKASHRQEFCTKKAI